MLTESNEILYEMKDNKTCQFILFVLANFEKEICIPIHMQTHIILYTKFEWDLLVLKSVVCPTIYHAHAEAAVCCCIK